MFHFEFCHSKINVASSVLWFWQSFILLCLPSGAGVCTFCHGRRLEDTSTDCTSTFSVCLHTKALTRNVRQIILQCNSLIRNIIFLSAKANQADHNNCRHPSFLDQKRRKNTKKIQNQTRAQSAHDTIVYKSFPAKWLERWRHLCWISVIFIKFTNYMKVRRTHPDILRLNPRNMKMINLVLVCALFSLKISLRKTETSQAGSHEYNPHLSLFLTSDCFLSKQKVGKAFRCNSFPKQALFLVKAH